MLVLRRVVGRTALNHGSRWRCNLAALAQSMSAELDL